MLPIGPFQSPSFLTIVIYVVFPTVAGSFVGLVSLFIRGRTLKKLTPYGAVDYLIYVLLAPFVAYFLLERSLDSRQSFLIGAALPLVADSLGRFPKNTESQRVSKLRETISKAEAEVQRQPEKTKPVWELSRATFELYLSMNLAQVRHIFWITILVMSAGFAMVVYGVYRAIDTQLQIAVLTAVSGVITQTIGATFLLIYRSAMKQASEHVATLERINSVGMAAYMVDLIPEESRDAKNKARADLAKQILSLRLPRPTTKDG